MNDHTGYLAEFIEKNRMVLGMVQTVKKTRLGLLTSQDKQVALAAGRVLLFSPAAMAAESPRAALVEYLGRVEARREELAGQVDVKELWELIQGEYETLPLGELTELQFDSPSEDDHKSAILRALFYEKLHFKLAGGEFKPLTSEQVEQKSLQREREALHRAEVDAAVAFFKAQAQNASPTPEAPPGVLEILRDLVVFSEDSPSAKKAKEIAALAELGGRRQIFKLLVRLGAVGPHENLHLLREGIPVEFPKPVLGQAEALDLQTARNQDRKDLTRIFTFTIDGAFTTDFDDALSFEGDPQGGGELGVHITDASSLIAPESALDLEARERATTLYLPDTRVPMLPPQISEGALSLRQGEVRPAVSCLAQISPEGEILSYRVVRSLVKVGRRFTYEEADELLDQDARLSGLWRTCHQLRSLRSQAGAFFLPLPEMVVWVDEKGQVHVNRVDREEPAREMVAETAILANLLKARFLLAQGIPALYRTQAPPSEPFEEGDPGNLFLHYSQRRLLNRVEISTTPGRHSSLGAEPYIQATSPIRRYLDLVMQRQLVSALEEGGALYSEEELRKLVMLVEPNLRKALRVRYARQRYWIQCWLAQRQDQLHPGIVMEHQTRRWQILMPEVMQLTSIPTQKGLVFRPGEEVMLKLVKVDPFFDSLKVELAK